MVLHRKKIIINGKFLTQRITGVQRYAREIVSELDKIIEPKSIIMAVPPEVKNIPDYTNIKVVKTGRFHNRLWEHISFPWFVHKNEGISLNLCNAAPISSPGIVCIHDVKIMAKPEYFSKKFVLWYNLLFWNVSKRSKKLITVSEFSKNEIIKYYHVEPEQITVIPNAWQHYSTIDYDENALNKFGLEKQSYCFGMSSLEPNKNFKWIAEVAKQNHDMTFAVAGSINKKVFADGIGFECPDNMKLLGYVSDEEAKTLMRDCKAFLFPSFYEGFGIPPLEAVSAGAKKIVVSNIPVMHEIFGESAIYINPEEYDVNLVECINTCEEVNRDVMDKYSWKLSAQKLLVLLK